MIPDREELELLRAEVSMLRKQIGMDAERSFITRCRDVFGATPGEARLLNALLACRVPNKDALMQCYSNGSLDEPDIKILDVLICRLRKKLEARDIIVETIWGVGYRLSEKDKWKVLHALDLAEAA